MFPQEIETLLTFIHCTESVPWERLRFIPCLLPLNQQHVVNHPSGQVFHPLHFHHHLVSEETSLSSIIDCSSKSEYESDFHIQY